MPRPPFRVPQILAWADAHHRRTGSWPNAKSGPIPDSGGANWKQVNNALRLGLRGMTGGSSLALLLADRRGVRNKASVPPLTPAVILSWADRHLALTGCFPSAYSGPVADAHGETWLAIDQALKHGCRGLPGGDSLGRLIARERGVRNRTNIPTLSVEVILGWADAHFARTGKWPNVNSGVIPESAGDTWGAIHGALYSGLRGLSGRNTLARLLRAHRPIPDPPARVCRRKEKVQAGRGRAQIRIEFPEEVLRQYREGELDLAGVARRAGVSPSVAGRELARAGVQVRGRGCLPRKGRHPRDPLATEAVRRYCAGQSLADVAVALGLTVARVRTLLIHRRVTIRPRSAVLVDGLSPAALRRFGGKLRGFREKAGLSQQELATKAQLGVETIARLERGETSPTRVTRDALAAALGLKPYRLTPRRR